MMKYSWEKYRRKPITLLMAISLFSAFIALFSTLCVYKNAIILYLILLTFCSILIFVFMVKNYGWMLVLISLILCVIVLIPSRVDSMLAIDFLERKLGFIDIFFLISITLLGLYYGIKNGITFPKILVTYAGFMFFLITISLLSVFVNINKYDSLAPVFFSFEIFYFPLILPIFMIDKNYNLSRINHLINIIVILGLIIGISGIFISLFGLKYLDYLGWEKMGGVIDISLVREHTTFGGAGPTGIFLVMCFFLLLAMYLNNRRKSVSIFYLCIIVVYSVAIVLTLTRSVILAFIFSFFTFVIVNHRKIFLRRTFFKFALFITLIFLLPIVLWFFFNLSRLVQFGHESDILRLSSLKVAFQIFRDYPFLGIGSGSFYPKDGEIELLCYNDMMTARDPHNLYALILSEQGIIGIIAHIAFFLFVLNIFYKNMEKIYIPDYYRTTLSGIFSGLIGLFIYSIFSSSIGVMIRLSIFSGIYIGLGIILIMQLRREEYEK